MKGDGAEQWEYLGGAIMMTEYVFYFFMINGLIRGVKFSSDGWASKINTIHLLYFNKIQQLIAILYIY